MHFYWSVPLIFIYIKLENSHVNLFLHLKLCGLAEGSHWCALSVLRDRWEFLGILDGEMCSCGHILIWNRFHSNQLDDSWRQLGVVKFKSNRATVECAGKKRHGGSTLQLKEDLLLMCWYQILQDTFRGLVESKPLHEEGRTFCILINISDTECNLPLSYMTLQFTKL